jgi:hypothetical protein
MWLNKQNMECEVRETFKKSECKLVRTTNLFDIMQPISRDSGAWFQLYKAKSIHIILVLTFKKISFISTYVQGFPVT